MLRTRFRSKQFCGSKLAQVYIRIREVKNLQPIKFHTLPIEMFNVLVNCEKLKREEKEIEKLLYYTGRISRATEGSLTNVKHVIFKKYLLKAFMNNIEKWSKIL